MDTDQVWHAIDAHRLSVAGLLDDLSEEDWSRPSLCDGWTVRDVAAHLTLQQLRPGRIFREVAQAPRLLVAGGVNAITRELAKQHSSEPTDQIIAAIRATVGSRVHNFGVTPKETLIDILVHSQDIAIPLNRRLDIPPDAAAFAATRAWRLRRLFRTHKKLSGFRLTATDTDWAVGEGTPVTGPITALLLVIAGRQVALRHLTGKGAATLTERVLTPRR
ncbi:uncharacterized protein (TIGR03083 family) [Kibdelosporangium banguiense]|uniref:Uncharacterized protein (TIGR03083 family) n=1 Tax=Kibdelosporangium banguiense TaxID=1365924 RepID=A0ABS4TMU2_9PSEU|nr:maleylpyruvate isomerase family mycothiol-dependent enzyme [Kibdelosporangium banguiense]MBP2325732.1 uncharacterized protein (TIGR03083 family) [Kibdelosporangium banguiense]